MLILVFITLLNQDKYFTLSCRKIYFRMWLGYSRYPTKLITPERKKKTKMGISSAIFSHFCDVTTNIDIIKTVSVPYCVSVLSSRDFCDMCSRNRFFCKEWSLTRQFSTRRSDTGEWSITVNLPPLETADSKRTKHKLEYGKKNCDKKWGTIKDCKKMRKSGCNKWKSGDGLF